jgi:predicted O-methyltransferase YrrM
MSLPKHIEEAIWHYIPSLEGWTTPERACEMADKILETKSKVSVDIGTFAGKSTTAMGFAARELGDSIVYGIDPWHPVIAEDSDDNKEGIEWWKEKANLEAMHHLAVYSIFNHHLEKWVVLIQSKSEYVHQLFTTIDVLNIDGAHGEVASCRDVTLYLPKVRSGGVIFFDDTDWQSTQKALGMLEEQCEKINDTGKARTYRKR